MPVIWVLDSCLVHAHKMPPNFLSTCKEHSQNPDSFCFVLFCFEGNRKISGLASPSFNQT